jgi:hypothetical protein
MQQTEDNHSKQPFYVVDDEAYDRMYEKLVSGERYVKTYLGVCPETCKCKCTCKFFLNFLKDGDIVRVSNGELKNVLSLSTFNELNEKKKFIQEYNNSLPQQTSYDSDGVAHTFAINGIYDSEQMCYLFENIDLYGRIKRIKAHKQAETHGEKVAEDFKRLMIRLEQDTLLSLIKILKLEFYENFDYGTPKDQRHVHLPDMLRPEIPLGQRKKTLIDEIRDELCRITDSVAFHAKIAKIYNSIAKVMMI